MLLVAADVVLVGDQRQVRVVGGRFRRSGMGKCAQDEQDCDVGGKDAEPDASDHGEAEDEGHQKRNHGCKSFGNRNLSRLIASACIVSRKASLVVCRLPKLKMKNQRPIHLR